MRTILELLKKYAYCWAPAAAIIFAMAFLLIDKGRIIDADMSGEMVLAKFLCQTGGIMTTEWFYPTEIRFINTHIIYKLGFLLFNSWTVVRVFTGVVLLSLLAAGSVFCVAQTDKIRNSALAAFIILMPFSVNQANFVVYGYYYITFTVFTLLAVGLFFMAASGASPRTRGIGTVCGCILAFLVGCGGMRMTLIIYLPLLIAILAVYLDRSLFSAAARSQEDDEKFAESTLHGIQLMMCDCMGVMFNYAILSKIYTYQTYDNARIHSFVLSDLISFIMYCSAAVFGFDNAPYYKYAEILSRNHMELYSQITAFGNSTLFTPEGMCYISSVCMFALLVLAFVVYILKWKELTSKVKMYLVFMISSVAINSLICILTANERPRYLMISLLLFLPLFSMFIGFVKEKKQYFLSSMLTVIMVGCVLFQSLVIIVKPALANYNLPTGREKAAKWLVENGYKNGFATYWNCNILTELSNGDLEMYIVIDTNLGLKTMEMYEWYQIKDHLKDPSGRIFLLLTDKEIKHKFVRYYIDDNRLVYDQDGIKIYEYASAAELRNKILGSSIADLMVRIDKRGRQDIINKHAEKTFVIAPQNSMSGPNLHLGAGDYVLHIGCRTAPKNIVLKVRTKDGMIVGQAALKKGHNEIPFHLEKEDLGIEFFAHNSSDSDLDVTGIYISKPAGNEPDNKESPEIPRLRK